MIGRAARGNGWGAVIFCSLTLRVEQIRSSDVKNARLGESSYGKTDRPLRA